MSKKINRVGEQNYNNFGSLMIIINYNSNINIDVYFPDYNWIKYQTDYNSFKKGNIRCPYEPRVYEKGYMGEGQYKSSKDGEKTEQYLTWKNMLSRCYDEKRYIYNPSYEGCVVSEEWLNYQNFAYWYDENYYSVYNETISLDKDILYKGNRIYSPETCIFVPQRINNLLIKSDCLRGELPVGVCNYKNNQFISYCSDGYGKTIGIGIYNTIEDAFQAYKDYKEKLIKKIADEYKNLIPNKLYLALYNYQVEIWD